MNKPLPDFTGIDAVIRKALIRTLNIERDVYGLECDSFTEDDVDIGVLSYTDDNAWTTYREVYAFDVYMELRGNGKTRRWTRGVRLHKRDR